MTSHVSSLDYEFLRQFLLERSGLSLGPDKAYLLQTRLTPLAQTMDLGSLAELVAALRKDPHGRLATAVTEAMTTNETSFFRDRTPFEELKERLLPELIQARAQTRMLRIWCAAASTGQEPYSIAMLIADEFPELAEWFVDIVGTDISADVLKRAQEGIYTQMEVQRGLPIQCLVKHFEQTDAGWQIKESLRRKVRFCQLNLLDDFRQLGRFDIIFCRNVLIYFEPDTKREILDRLHEQLRPDGYLLLGAAETVIGITSRFARLRDSKTAVYVPASGAESPQTVVPAEPTAAG